jgi:hypothetical protein
VSKLSSPRSFWKWAVGVTCKIWWRNEKWWFIYIYNTMDSYPLNIHHTKSLQVLYKKILHAKFRQPKKGNESKQACIIVEKKCE